MDAAEPHPTPGPVAWSTTRVEHDGLRFDVRTAGPGGTTAAADAPLVLLLHGFPQTSLSWTAVGERLVAAGLRVAAPDQRGYSPGARPDAVDDYRVPRLVADALAVADDVGRPGAPFHLVGHDWGACVAWWLAAEHPDRVASLTALSIPHLAAFGHALATDPEQQRLSRYIGVFREPGRAERALLDDDAAALRAIYDGVVTDHDVEAYVGTFRDGAITPALAWYRAMDRSVNDLGPVAVPTTFAWGEGDRAVAASGAHACGDHVRADYRFEAVAGATHWLPDEVPGLVADLVVDRVRGRAGGRAGGGELRT